MYLPYLFLNISGAQLSERLLAVFFIGMFGVLTGSFIDREKRYRDQSEKDRYLAGLGRVATNIVHDLKNPLITIIGFANRIHEKKGSCEEAAVAIADSAQSMQNIVHDVLDFAKPVQFDMKKQDVRDCIKRSCEICRVKADETGIALSIDLPPNPVKAMVDSFRLERALSNLISNAVEASGKGQTVSIRIISGKQHLAIGIQDHGSGMNRETIENIFIPFYTKKSYGTGLGMPIVKKIIDGHNGKILINSKPGQGTSVEIRLPYASVSEEAHS
jgi:signal transduction histidine kinase